MIFNTQQKGSVQCTKCGADVQVQRPSQLFVELAYWVAPEIYFSNLFSCLDIRQRRRIHGYATAYTINGLHLKGAWACLWVSIHVFNNNDHFTYRGERSTLSLITLLTKVKEWKYYHLNVLHVLQNGSSKCNIIVRYHIISHSHILFFYVKSIFKCQINVVEYKAEYLHLRCNGVKL